jgi:hypothetical protein
MQQQTAEGPREFFKRLPVAGDCKNHSRHSQRRTAVRASENVTSCLPSHSIARSRAYRRGKRLYTQATTLYNPNRHGATRSTVFSFQPRVVSNPGYERISWKVVSMNQP